MDRSPVSLPGRRYEMVVAGCLLLIAVLFFGWARLQSAASQWQAHYEFVPVLATVQKSGIGPADAGAAGGENEWRPVVAYQYAFGSSLYEQNRLSYMDDGWPDRAAVDGWLTGYDKGSTVTAYVNPADPREAVLDNHAPDSRFLFYLLPFLMLGVLLLIAGLRRRS